LGWFVLHAVQRDLAFELNRLMEANSWKLAEDVATKMIAIKARFGVALPFATSGVSFH
jgi:hypothetical protein